MKSYVVSWFDSLGRYRVKQYLYRRCAEKFAERLLNSGLYIGRVRFDEYSLQSHVGRWVSRGCRF